MDFVGMVTEQGHQHAERLRRAQQRLVAEHEALAGTVRASQGFWNGPDAETFRTDWNGDVALMLQQLAATLAESAAILEQDVEEQEAASASDSAGEEVGDSGRAAPGRPGARYGGDGDGRVGADVARAWEGMSPEEQRRVLQEIADQELERQGHDGVAVHFEELDELGYDGYWTEYDLLRPWRGEHIILDPDLVGDPAALNIVAHEARHSAQNHWIDETDAPPGWQFWREDDSAEEYERIEQEHGITQEEIEAWRENDQDYTQGPAEDRPGPGASQEEIDAWERQDREYREQPLEVDAYDTGDEFADEISLEELQQYQRDAGVPVSP